MKQNQRAEKRISSAKYFPLSSWQTAILLAGGFATLLSCALTDE
jgi:hypothetical protein